MKAHNPIPSPRIASCVERILVIENYEVMKPFSLPLFANGLPTLLFKSTKAMLGKKAASHLTLFGQTILPDTLTLTEDFTLIAYFFKPYSLQSVFGVAALELTDKPLDLELIIPQKTGILRERLLNAATTEKRILLLDDFIADLVNHSKAEVPLVNYASTRIARHPTKEILGLVQKELHMTERTFQRLFEHNIGISPNQYRRICQFNTAFEQLNYRKFQKLSDLAFEHGYADQSHYIRAFREFTNLTPNEYLHYGS